MMYTPVNVDVPTNQHEKIKNALNAQKSVTVKVNLHGSGNHVLLLTNAQIDRVERARLIGKPKLSIHLSKKQVKANIQHHGGFLGMLAGLAAKVLPSLLGGLATGALSGAVSKLIGGGVGAGNGLYLHPSGRRTSVAGGDGLYLHKSGHCVKVEPVKGNGLYLTPHTRLSGGHGDGLYLKRGSQIYDGQGLLLGRNSPFKNIPILNLLL